MQIFLLEIEPSCQNAIVLVAQMREQPYPDSGLSLVMQYSHRWPMTGASALIIGRKKTTKRGNTKEERKKKWNQAICTRVQKYKLIPSVLSLTLDTFSQFSLKSRNGKEIEKRDSSDRKWELCGGWTERQFSVCSNLYRGVNTSSATTNSHMWANTAASALRYAIQIP